MFSRTVDLARRARRIPDRLMIETRRRRRRPAVVARNYNKVFCVGPPKTGTSSIGYALRSLGFRHKTFDPELQVHYNAGRIDEILAAAVQFESFDDGPWNCPSPTAPVGPPMYRLCDERFPNSKFILTVRDVDSWARSHRAHFAKDGARIISERWMVDDYDALEFEIVTAYRTHLRNVQQYFGAESDRLLTIDVTSGDGWAELCGFLELPVPRENFPVRNVTPTHDERRSR